MKYIAIAAALYVGFTQGFTPSSVSLIAFILWTIPLNLFRTRFRMLIYKTKDWKIALKPIFFKEIKGLFGNIYPNNKEYTKYRNFYRLYLGIFLVLYLIWKIISSYS